MTEPIPGTPPPPESEPESEPESRQKRIRLAEDIFILVCIFSLWPVVLGWKGAVYQAILYAALIGLVAVFVRRVRRLTRARENTDE